MKRYVCKKISLLLLQKHPNDAREDEEDPDEASSDNTVRFRYKNKKKTNKIKQRNNLDQKIIQTINTFANFFLIAIRIPHGEK